MILELLISGAVTLFLIVLIIYLIHKIRLRKHVRNSKLFKDIKLLLVM
jgi:hypothetical protein